MAGTLRTLVADTVQAYGVLDANAGAQKPRSAHDARTHEWGRLRQISYFSLPFQCYMARCPSICSRYKLVCTANTPNRLR
jgi:hypothetical protein